MSDKIDMPPRDLMLVTGDRLIAWHSDFSSIRVLNAAQLTPQSERPDGTVAILHVSLPGVEKHINLSADAVASLVRQLQATLPVTP